MIPPSYNYPLTHRLRPLIHRPLLTHPPSIHLLLIRSLTAHAGHPQIMTCTHLSASRYRATEYTCRWMKANVFDLVTAPMHRMTSPSLHGSMKTEPKQSVIVCALTSTYRVEDNISGKFMKSSVKGHSVGQGQQRLGVNREQ